MQEVWKRIESWLSTQESELWKGLNPGATDAEIAETEAFLGVTFPEEVRECYRIHNGQQPDAPGLFPGGEFLSLQQICAQWKIWKDLLDRGDLKDSFALPNNLVRDDPWNIAWIPITHNGGGDHYCLDLDPAEGGTVGQTFDFHHDNPEYVVAAPNLTTWLQELADGLESGKYFFDMEEYYGMVMQGDNMAEPQAGQGG